MDEISTNSTEGYSQGTGTHSQDSSGASSVNYDAVNVVAVAGNGALDRIESLLEAIVDAVTTGNEILIPYRTVRASRPGRSQGPPAARQAGVVRFPGRTIQEAKKFEALLCIIELSHEALLSGMLITKRSVLIRNIYYQSPDLFGSQAAVDVMVDNLAFTLGVGRGDLNIVATAKGLISGPFMLISRDGSVIDCGLSHSTGILLPSTSEIRSIGFHEVQWILLNMQRTPEQVTESSSRYGFNITDDVFITKFSVCQAKGFPDLATRRFLSVVHSMRPSLVIFGLADFDPDGISIVRTYQNGSRRLEHENEATVPSLCWLGIKSRDLLSSWQSPAVDDEEDQELHGTTGGGSPQLVESEQVPFFLFHFQNPSDKVSSLTLRDRKKAGDILRAISSVELPSGGGLEHAQELQRMLMLNIKAEIQAVDSYGDLSTWLDDNLCARMHAD
ncbi:uncharacterized protein PODANS_2_7480 [Podospora anserina S mat+]|uniref:DNA topoisomerase (ATP-hydrolyzing) n=1 Tax=Podospora anserina (strain S / ATCC MYA-4624 / DSM 980 / FGSC 10383) TaxID=515849 RepID=B2B6D6_PODAN|nr:uncharacterized protein PODANS_2_7480 [Podospora anserina S mat+]CAP73361.1 unnamed protein product [Podospora anserina S mat+]CDP25766.1 Putative meiosis-specific topoisomerase [Podospora anserina S mat+]